MLSAFSRLLFVCVAFLMAALSGFYPKFAAADAISQAVSEGFLACVDNGTSYATYKQHILDLHGSPIPEEDRSDTAKFNSYDEWLVTINGITYRTALTPWFFCLWQLPATENDQEPVKTYIESLLGHVKNRRFSLE